MSASRFSRCPTTAEKLDASTVAREGVRWSAAFTVVSTTAGVSSPSARIDSVAMRLAAISGFGETRS
jgi:hypothetical protein